MKTADAAVKADNKAEQDGIRELINLYTQLEQIKQQEAQLNATNKATSGQTHAAELAALAEQRAQIEAKISDATRYSEAQRQAAQNSQQVTAAVNQTAQAQARAADSASSLNMLTQRLVTMFGSMVLMKGFREMWSGATEYAKEYYDQMNEIQVVTTKSSAEIEQLSTKYRDMAKEMSVSSQEIASAATTFYRQGLSDTQVEERLKYTTQFAKVASMDFNSAAELITATANSMGDQIQEDIQRVVDVFVYLGDNAGTSGEEVAKAMQKSAAAAGQFGVSFEWLGAYIATVSETTRQAAEVVGTSLNSIIARMHSIRTTGYNSEDETKINDVAKALATLDIALLDQEGNWRDMTDIFNDIAAQWDTLDGKQRSYIATTMAGTRQQNTFLALMNDLSKGIEGGSRAWELYQGAMLSTGTVAEKYEIWEQSVEAANGRLQASLESAYSVFVDGGVIAGFKNFEAGFVNLFTEATKATGGLNLVAGALAGIAVAFGAASASGVTFASVLSTIEAHPVILAISAAIAAIAALSAVIGTAAGAAKRAYAEAAEEFENAQNRLSRYTEIQRQFADMEKEVSAGNKTLKEYSGLLDALGSLSPTASAAVAGLKDGTMSATEGFRVLNEEIGTLLEREQQLEQRSFQKMMDNYKVPDDVKKSGEQFATAWEDLWKVMDIDTTSTTKRNQSIWNLLDQRYFTAAEDAYLERYGVEFRHELTKLLDQFDQDIDAVLASTEGQDLFRRLWEEMIYGLDTESASRTAEFDKMFDSMMAALGDEVPASARGYLRNVIFEAVTGDDGILSNSDLGKLGSVMGDMFRQIMNAGFANTEWGDQTEIIAYARQQIVEAWKSAMELDGDYSWTNMGLAMPSIDLSMIENDLETLTKVNTLLASGAMSFDEFKAVLADSKDIDDFNERLKNLKNTVAEPVTTGGSVEEGDNTIVSTVKTLGDITKDAADSMKDLKKVRDSLKDGDPVEAKDLMAIMEIKPELLGLINDTEEFNKALDRGVKEQGDRMVEAAKSYILNSTEIAKNSPFKDMLEGENDALQKYVDGINTGTDKGKAEMAEFNKWMNTILFSMMDSMGLLGDMSEETISEIMTNMFPDVSPEVLARPMVQAAELVKKGWSDAGDSIRTYGFGSSIAAGDQDWITQQGNYGMNAVINVTPVLPDGKTIKTEKEITDYLDGLMQKSSTKEELFANDEWGIVLSVDTDVTSWKEAIQNSTTLAERLALLQAAFQGLTPSQADEEDALTKMAAQAELAIAKQEGYITQLDTLNQKMKLGGFTAAQEWFNTDLTEDMQKALTTAYPMLITMMKQGADAEKAYAENAEGATDQTVELAKAIAYINELMTQGGEDKLGELADKARASLAKEAGYTDQLQEMLNMFDEGKTGKEIADRFVEYGDIATGMSTTFGQVVIDMVAYANEAEGAGEKFRESLVKALAGDTGDPLGDIADNAEAAIAKSRGYVDQLEELRNIVTDKKGADASDAIGTFFLNMNKGISSGMTNSLSEVVSKALAYRNALIEFGEGSNEATTA